MALQIDNALYEAAVAATSVSYGDSEFMAHREAVKLLEAIQENKTIAEALEAVRIDPESLRDGFDNENMEPCVLEHDHRMDDENCVDQYEVPTNTWIQRMKRLVDLLEERGVPYGRGVAPVKVLEHPVSMRGVDYVPDIQAQSRLRL